MILIALMNLILPGGKMLLISNLVIAMTLGISLFMSSTTTRYALSYYTAYLLVTGLSYYISYSHMKDHRSIEVEKNEYEKFVENMPIAFANHKFIYDEDGKVIDYFLIDMNRAFEQILKVKKENSLGKNLTPDLIENKENVSKYVDIFAMVAETGKVMTLDQHLTSVDKWIRVTAYSEEPGYFKAFFHDITEEKTIEMALKSSEQRYRKIFTAAPIGLMIEDDQGNIIEVNEALCQMSGYKKEELESKNVIDRLALPEHRALAQKNIEKIINGEDLEFDIKSSRKNGEVFYTHLKETRFILPDGSKGIISMHLDITNRQKQADEIEYLLYRDVLTGLYNRRFFEAELKRLDSKRQLPISIIMADVNGLKMINDSFGHEKGDELLIKAAEILKDSLREEDILARQGGDEFAILLPQTDQKSAQEVVQRIKNKCELTTVDEISISICFGIGTKEAMGKPLIDTLKVADDAMYQTKLLESKSTKSKIIQSLLNALSVKSFETKEHGLRMANLATELGKSLNLSGTELNRLSLLATLHDIGKTTIPEEILTKPHRLNNEEWEIIKKHPEQGYNIASASPEFALVAEEILCHHERWDGTGYPQKLSGKEIPYLARMIAIIDAYDVMTMGRPYNRLLTKEEALEEIEECSGSQFDPYLAEEFIKLMGNH
jgi:diguanylate cyclase (GGDEF)-like protein/PAS domain S-box-containing protein